MFSVINIRKLRRVPKILYPALHTVCVICKILYIFYELKIFLYTEILFLLILSFNPTQCKQLKIMF